MKKFLSIIIAVITMLSFSSMMASAAKASKSKPLSVTVTTSSDSVPVTGAVLVTVKVENISANTVNNIVVTSEKSEGLVYFKPIAYSVVVKNGADVAVDRNSMTASLEAGGTLTYSYFVFESYQEAKDSLTSFESLCMKAQHAALSTKEFKELGLSGSNVSASKALTFGDFDSTLKVTAYYGLSDDDYSAAGSSSPLSLENAISSLSSIVKNVADSAANAISKNTSTESTTEA